MLRSTVATGVLISLALGPVGPATTWASPERSPTQSPTFSENTEEVEVAKRKRKRRRKKKRDAKQAPKVTAAKPDYAAAKVHYQNAELAAQRKEWASAAKEYLEAFEITKDPVLFFKLGNAYQLLGDCTRATVYFRRYLDEAAPAEEFRLKTEARVAKCAASNTAGTAATGKTDAAPLTTGADQSSKPTPVDPAASTSSQESSTQESSALPLATPGEGQNEGGTESIDALPDVDQSSWHETAAWTSVGLSVAFLTAGAVFGLSAKSRQEDLGNLQSFRDGSMRPTTFNADLEKRYDKLVDEGERLDTMTVAALGLAGASLGAAIVFLLLDDSPESEQSLTELGPQLRNGSVGVQAGWRF